ncbi:hypothetical protein AFL01nite_16420 [Aeromicrobium flavum]|uniref:Peptidase M10 metallopeptidase domain-containing protein n=1 Tax=Aeromicrobium flavum TaxID=416568 RepID=A0A512HV52_9ACTN|nr:hypothetical protein [Aeromicrobium flavum]GEO89315.1 hypothetical protein AFL01nite_16420 [Aeromicrobium flavum]
MTGPHRLPAPAWFAPVAWTAVLLLSLVLWPMSVASASNNDLIDPDNADHHVDRNSLTSSGDSAALRGISELNRTKMNATVNGSGDVEVYDSSYGDSGSWHNVRGRATCVNKTTLGLECDVWEVKFNQTNISGSSAWLHVGCHEFGHTAGISHRSSDNDSNDNSCMRSGGTNANLDEHDIDVINDDV